MMLTLWQLIFTHCDEHSRVQYTIDIYTYTLGSRKRSVAMKSWHKIYLQADNRPIFFLVDLNKLVTSQISVEFSTDKLMDGIAMCAMRICVYFTDAHFLESVRTFLLKIPLASFCIFGNFCCFHFIPYSISLHLKLNGEKNINFIGVEWTSINSFAHSMISNDAAVFEFFHQIFKLYLNSKTSKNDYRVLIRNHNDQQDMWNLNKKNELKLTCALNKLYLALYNISFHWIHLCEYEF